MFRTSSTADIMCLSLANSDSNNRESSLGKVYLTATASGPPELVSLGENSELSSNSSYGSLAALAAEECTLSTTAAAVADGAANMVVGKRRKTSRDDSPKSSVFDVATLVDAIHREVEGPEEIVSAPTSSSRSTIFSSPLTADDRGDEESDDYNFAFVDISEAAPAREELGFPCLDGLSKKAPKDSSLPTLTRRPSGGALGKRSRGLVRSQTVAIDLCLLGGGED